MIRQIVVIYHVLLVSTPVSFGRLATRTKTGKLVPSPRPSPLALYPDNRAAAAGALSSARCRDVAIMYARQEIKIKAIKYLN